jgi:hypothetical protein
MSTAVTNGSSLRITGANVTLQDVHLKGHGNSNGKSLVTITGGSLTMNGGSISGNTTTGDGGGVSVTSGTFTMNSGSISGNTAVQGGGVYVAGGTFTWNGGTISGNTPKDLFPSIGDPGPGGGIIFYYSPAGFTMTDDGSTAHFLEVATADLPGTYAWDANPANYVSGSYIGPLLSTTSSAIGAGRQNTQNILAEPSITPAAAQACVGYTGGGYNDWYLPSVDELLALCEVNKISPIFNLLNIPFATNSSAVYWTSTEDIPTGAWYVTFSDLGVQDNGNRWDWTRSKSYSASIYVRPIRAF